MHAGLLGALHGCWCLLSHSEHLLACCCRRVAARCTHSPAHHLAQASCHRGLVRPQRTRQWRQLGAQEHSGQVSDCKGILMHRRRSETSMSLHQAVPSCMWQCVDAPGKLVGDPP